MSIRNALRAVAHKARAIPGQLGWRNYTVSIQHTSWPGAERGDGGTSSTTTTAITEADGQPPKVRWLSGQELVMGGFDAATLEVGPITPDFPGGGTALGVLKPHTAGNDEVALVVTGPEYPEGQRFRIVDYTTDRAGHWLVRAQQTA